MKNIIVTAGALYLDIDAYACCVALAELLQYKGINARAYSTAPCNYSVCQSVIEENQILDSISVNSDEAGFNYIIVDVSDPEYIEGSVPIEKIIEIYDHHLGHEEYWENRIGEKAHIEFIGATATMIYREWKKEGVFSNMRRSTALLLVAAILDNTLNLTSQNTRQEDIDAYNELCNYASVGDDWRSLYFSEVQANVETDLKVALNNDLKRIKENDIIPPYFYQISVWNTQSIFNRLPEIRQWFEMNSVDWVLNIIDIKNKCSYFVCDNSKYQQSISKVFGVSFDGGIAKSHVSYLRKEILKKVQEHGGDS